MRDRHRPAHLQPCQGVDQRVGPEPRVGAQRQRPGGASVSHPGDELFDEALVRRAAKIPCGAGRAAPRRCRPGWRAAGGSRATGVAVGGTVLGLAVHLADRRVQIDRHRAGARSRAQRPSPSERLGDHRVELADVAERERAQERAERRRSHHPERQHPPVAPARSLSAWSMWDPPARIAATSVRTLRPGRRATDPADEPHRLSSRALRARGGPSTSPARSTPRRRPTSRRRRSPRCGRSRAILDSLEVPPGLWRRLASNTVIVPAQGGSFADTRPLSASNSSVDRG